MNAKTPEERNALMAGHMKAMQDGMGMMKGISARAARALWVARAAWVP
jgi:hypothetical protein